MPFKPLPPVEKLRARFRYDPETGDLYVRGTAGERLVRLTKGQRYLIVSVGKVKTYAHRVIWKLSHGVDPVKLVDHIDGDKTNNRISNLRLADRAKNIANSVVRTVLPKGVFFDRRANRYRARIRVAGRASLLGSFPTAELAATAYQAAATARYGAFVRFE